MKIKLQTNPSARQMPTHFFCAYKLLITLPAEEFLTRVTKPSKAYLASPSAYNDAGKSSLLRDFGMQ